MHEHSGAYLKTAHIDAMPGGKKALAAKIPAWTSSAHSCPSGQTQRRDRQALQEGSFKRLRREKDAFCLHFLEVDGVEWHNNSAERGIRPCVILRNNSYGSRSEEGAAAIAVLMSVKQTCKAKKDNFLDLS